MTEDKTDVDSLVVALLRADKIVRQMAGDGVMFDFEAPPTALELEAADLITRLRSELSAANERAEKAIEARNMSEAELADAVKSLIRIADGQDYRGYASAAAQCRVAAYLITRLTRERDEAIEALRPFAEADSGRVALEVRTIDVSRARALTTGDAT